MGDLLPRLRVIGLVHQHAQEDVQGVGSLVDLHQCLTVLHQRFVFVFVLLEYALDDWIIVVVRHTRTIIDDEGAPVLCRSARRCPSGRHRTLPGQQGPTLLWEKEMINIIVTRLRAEAEVICLQFVEGRRRLTSLLGGGQGIQVALERLGVSFRGVEAVAEPAFKSYMTSNANANVTQGRGVVGRTYVEWNSGSSE